MLLLSCYILLVKTQNRQEKLTDVEVDVEYPVELDQLRRGLVSLEGDGGDVGEARVVQRHLCK